MLQYRAVYPETLELLKRLMQLDSLLSFNLVGGTALALQLGHRISVDLDLFGKGPTSHDQILADIKNFTLPQIERQLEGTLILTVNGIKVDVISYPYDEIAPLILEDGIRLLSKKDIAPMKLSAIAGRGSKKDFFDFASFTR